MWSVIEIKKESDRLFTSTRPQRYLSVTDPWQCCLTSRLGWKLNRASQPIWSRACSRALAADLRVALCANSLLTPNRHTFNIAPPAGPNAGQHSCPHTPARRPSRPDTPPSQSFCTDNKPTYRHFSVGQWKSHQRDRYPLTQCLLVASSWWGKQTTGGDFVRGSRALLAKAWRHTSHHCTDPFME